MEVLREPCEKKIIKFSKKLEGFLEVLGGHSPTNPPLVMPVGASFVLVSLRENRIHGNSKSNEL